MYTINEFIGFIRGFLYGIYYFFFSDNSEWEKEDMIRYLKKQEGSDD